MSEALTTVVVDGHVHVYDLFDPETFLAAVELNLQNFGDGPKVLMLAEGRSADWFGGLRAGSARLPAGYAVEATGEDSSLMLTKFGKPLCWVIAGRQIVTAEDLEIIRIGSPEVIPDGHPIDQVVKQVLDGPGIAVLAWGVGKWLFGRGRIIGRIQREFFGPRLFVGDNRGRPVWWGRPRQFDRARRLGMQVLAGSDPLPFAEEQELVGSYGFTLDCAWDPRAPAHSVLSALTQGAPATTVGHRDGPMAFFSRQWGMFKKKHLRR